MEVRSKTIGVHQEFRDLDTRKMLLDSLIETKPCEIDIAKIISKMFGDRFICSDAKKNVWYEFRGHMWYKTSGEFELQTLVNDILDKYLNLRSELRQDEARYLDTNQESFDKAKQIKKISRVIECLKNNSFKERVLKECRIYMYNRLNRF